MRKFKFTAYTTKAYEIVVESDTIDQAWKQVGDIDPNDPRWKENYNAGGGWEILDSPQEVK